MRQEKPIEEGKHPDAGSRCGLACLIGRHQAARRAAGTCRMALALAVLMALTPLCSFCSFAAAGPMGEKINDGYDAETWATLTDNVLEYDEVPTLVHEFNTTMQNQYDSLERTRQEMVTALNDLNVAKWRADRREESAEEDGDTESMINAVTSSVILRTVITSLDSSAVNLLSSVTLASLTKAENTITMYAQSALISYDSLRASRETLLQMQELYDRQYQILQRQQELGMATSTEVLEAQMNQLSAESNIMAIDSGITQLLNSLCTLVGFDPNDPPTIAPIPMVDLSLIDEMDLDADTQKAIGNNSTLQTQRKTDAGKTNAEVATRLALIDEGETKMRIKMEELYSDVQAKRVAFEGAQAGFESAQKSAAYYQKMYELGMLSETQYISYMLGYYSEKATYDNADTSLRLAIETYNWAKLGLVDPD